MLTLLLSPALSLTSLLPVSLIQAAPPWNKDELAPPGLIHIKGGSTFIGSNKKDIENLLKELPGAASRALRALDAETPQHRLSVNPFHMGLTEVTNEQYAVFVTATGHRPPEDWGNEAINTAQREFLNEQGKKRQEAQADGRPIPARVEFERDGWWLENWKQSPWAIPEASFVYHNPQPGMLKGVLHP